MDDEGLVKLGAVEDEDSGGEVRYSLSELLLGEAECWSSNLLCPEPTCQL